MLALADKNGEVEGSIPGLADMARVSIEETKVALEKFLSPDEFSRSKEHDGRRIAETDGGWVVLNYEKHRNFMSHDDRRERDRIRQQRHRDKLSRVTCDVSRESLQSEAEAESKAEAYAKARNSAYEIPKNLDLIMEEIRAIGFRDSKASAAEHALVEEVAAGSDPGQIAMALCRIYVWTENGRFAPKLAQVIPRWNEREPLWRQERKPTNAKKGLIDAIRDNRTMPDFGHDTVPPHKPVAD